MSYTCASCGRTFRFPQWECGSCRADFCISCAERAVQHAHCAAPIRPFAIPAAPVAIDNMIPDAG
jgi:hypothetical protein